MNLISILIGVVLFFILNWIDNNSDRSRGFNIAMQIVYYFMSLFCLTTLIFFIVGLTNSILEPELAVIAIMVIMLFGTVSNIVLAVSTMKKLPKEKRPDRDGFNSLDDGYKWKIKEED